MNRTKICLSFLPVVLVMIGCGGSARTAAPPAATDPDVLAIIDGAPLTLEEFEERYARTVGGRAVAAHDSVEKYEDFLDRYVNFRVKVKAGIAAGLSADAGIRQEIDSYRYNLARPYLLDREVLDPIIRTIHERQQYLVDASHILIRVAPAAEPDDTLAAYNRLSAIADSIRQGADFGAMAETHSEDPSASRAGVGYQGRLGYFSAGRMVKEFEDAAYEGSVGEVVGPFRTQFGYHILKIEDRRPAIPDVDVAHIMIVPAGATAEDSVAALDKANQLATELAQGADFAALAMEHSADAQSAQRGGEIGTISFSNQRIPESFREAAFALTAEDDVSDVVETPFGYHLIKLSARHELPTLEEAYEDLKNLASRLPQAREGEGAFARRIWASYGGSIDTALVVSRFGGLTRDSLTAIGGSDETLETLDSEVFAVLADSSYTLADIAAYARTKGLQPATDMEAVLVALVQGFATEKAIDFESAALEYKDDEFGQIMAEFREGLVLFKLMEDSVWTRAAADSIALEAYFDANRRAYNFPERTRVLAYFGASDSTLRILASHLEERDDARVEALLAQEDSGMRVDTVRITETTNSVYDQILGQDEGTVLGPLRHNREWVVLLHDGSEAPRPKTFEEARAAVVSEYQDVLEAELVERLRKQFDVHVYPERVRIAFDDAVAPNSAQNTSAE